MTAWWAVAVGAVVLVVVAGLIVLRRRAARATAASVSDWRSRAASGPNTASGPSSSSGSGASSASASRSDLDSRTTAASASASGAGSRSASRAARRSGSRRRAASRSPLPSASSSGSRTSPDTTDDPFARYPTARQRPVPNPTTRLTPPRDPSRNRPYLAPLPTPPLDHHRAADNAGPTPPAPSHHDAADGATRVPSAPDSHRAAGSPVPPTPEDRNPAVRAANRPPLAPERRGPESARANDSRPAPEQSAPRAAGRDHQHPPRGDSPSMATGAGRPQPRQEEASGWERPQPARQGIAPTSAAGSYPHPAAGPAAHASASQPRASQPAAPEHFDSSGTTPTQPVYLPDLRHTGPGRTRRTPDTTTWPDAGLPQPRNSPSLRTNRDTASFSSMPSHQPGAQRPLSVDETRHPVHNDDSRNETSNPVRKGHPGSDSERDWPGNPRLHLVDQEHEPGDRRHQPVEPQPGVPAAGNVDRGRRLVGPPERRRWGRGTRPPEDEPGKNPRRPDDR